MPTQLEDGLVPGRRENGMGGSEALKSRKKTKILFLLRTYNDIDHISPIMWKSVTAGWHVFFAFVDRDYSEDYRIKFVAAQGARQIRSGIIEWYHDRLRHFLTPRLLKRICDRAVAYLFGSFLLIRNHIDVIANEWSGPFGRKRAEYFLRAGALLRLPVYSLPHGYMIFINPFFNKEVTDIYEKRGGFPDFSNRSWFTKYVVQSREQKKAGIDYGMNANNLVVLGSARFCKEWSAINYDLLCGTSELSRKELFTILFFLPHWDYNVHRNKCISLLEKISSLKNVHLDIKAHTRGFGALDSREKEKLGSRPNVTIPDEAIHSTLLVNSADVVVNFGSSVAFEAMRQGKPVINPMYLHDNRTFFDHSGAVIDTSNEESTLNCILEFQSGRGSAPGQLHINEFLLDRVDGASRERDVLQSYLDLLSGHEVQSSN